MLLTTNELHNEMDDANYENRVISFEAAQTIASFWQSPAGSGKAFAELASTGKADLEELQDAVKNAERWIAGVPDAYTADDVAELAAFADWLRAQR